MKNKMPIAEMDNVVKEVCDALDYSFKTLSKYYRSNECLAAGYTGMLSSATYYRNMNQWVIICLWLENI